MSDGPPDPQGRTQEPAGTSSIPVRTVEFPRNRRMETLGRRHRAERIHFAVEHAFVAT